MALFALPSPFRALWCVIRDAARIWLALYKIMLAKAREKSRARGVAGYRLGLADCRVLPVRDNTVAAVTMAKLLRHGPDLNAVPPEAHR